MSKQILILPGDGIGPEIMAEAVKVLELASDKFNLGFELTHDLIGGAAIDQHGVPLADETLERARAADAVLLGAVGGPKWDKIERDIRPERGLLKIRAQLGLFGNLRRRSCIRNWLMHRASSRKSLRAWISSSSVN